MAILIHTSSGVSPASSTTSLLKLDREEKCEDETETLEMFDPSAHPNATQMSAAQISLDTSHLAKVDSQDLVNARMRTPVGIRPLLDMEALFNDPVPVVRSSQTPSSLCAPSPRTYKTQFVPPPPQRTSVSSQGGNASSQASVASSPTFASIETVAQTPTSTKHVPAQVCPYTPGAVAQSRMAPVNYMQNAKGAFGDRSEQPMYGDGNASPFCTNASHTVKTGSPKSPSRRGRGILDNDPAIYLEGGDESEESSMWDTAARWAKAAGKRLSAGEQTLWKMVGVSGDDASL